MCIPQKPAAQQPKIPFARDADISWLLQMEATGYKFYGSNGKHQDCLRIFKAQWD